MKIFLDKIREQNLDDLIIATCKIPLPLAIKSLHATMPELLNRTLLEYDKRGLELLNYEPPNWVVDYIFDTD